MIDLKHTLVVQMPSSFHVRDGDQWTKFHSTYKSIIIIPKRKRIATSTITWNCNHSQHLPKKYPMTHLLSLDKYQSKCGIAEKPAIHLDNQWVR